MASLSGVEAVKQESHRLRGTLAAEVASDAVQFSDAAYNLLKFHGSYEQYDRDTATARKQAGQEKDWQLMVRVRAPGGRLTAAQYLALDDLAGRYANGTLRITTRQGIQFHGVLKGDLKATIQGMDAALLTSFAACGDVVRNVTSTAAPVEDAVHRALDEDSALLSTALLPKSRAYHEIWLDGEKLGDGPDEAEPLYGPTYLPRKFKIGLAEPQDNAIDVLTNDLGFVAIVEGGELVGYNVAVGGGLGMTHNKPHTYPRLATEIAYVPRAQLLRAAEAVIAFQRDHGDRTDRKHARLKYVIDAMGVAAATTAIARYYGAPLAASKPHAPFAVKDDLGRHPQGDGRWWLGVPVPSGRIGGTLREALRAVAETIAGRFVVTAQQDVLIADLAEADLDRAEALLRAHGVVLRPALTPLSRWALACPALPTCGQALSEAERIREPVVERVEAMLHRLGLAEETLSLRLAGCPNACSRPYTGDIGIVGRTANDYALFVGGDFAGTRLNARIIDRAPLDGLLASLETLLGWWGRERAAGEGFGDWAHRAGVEALAARLSPAAGTVAA